MSLDLTTLRRRLQKALGKKFTVGDVLGEGGFAAVFRVRDQEQGQDVAVKVLDLGLTPSPGLAERFVREARTSGRLEHPHIVPIYKVGGYKNEVLYIVMRCIDGASLRQLLERHRRLSLRDAARIARQVADALGHAHLQGVVHRDAKPANILLDSTGHVLVTAFGIAKAAQDASASQRALGPRWRRGPPLRSAHRSVAASPRLGARAHPRESRPSAAPPGGARSGRRSPLRLLAPRRRRFDAVARGPPQRGGGDARSRARLSPGFRPGGLWGGAAGRALVSHGSHTAAGPPRHRVSASVVPRCLRAVARAR